MQTVFVLLLPGFVSRSGRVCSDLGQQVLSTIINIAVDYALWVTGAGDLTTQPTPDGVVYALKVRSHLERL